MTNAAIRRGKPGPRAPAAGPRCPSTNGYLTGQIALDADGRLVGDTICV